MSWYCSETYMCTKCNHIFTVEIDTLSMVNNKKYICPICGSIGEKIGDISLKDIIEKRLRE